MRPPDRARRRLLGCALGGATLSLLPACAPAPPLRVAAHVWPGYELMFLARSLGWLPAGTVTLIETRNASDSLAALKRGEVDAAALTLDETLRACADGVPLVVTLVFDISAGADVVMARPGVGSPRDLAGRRVGVETSALGALMLHKLLKNAGLTPADLTVVPVAIDDHLAAWDRERLDAIVTYEPAASRLAARGARRLLDSRAFPDTILDVLAVRADAMETHAAALRALTTAHFRALRHLRTNPYDAGHRLAARLGMPAGQTFGAFRGLQLPTIEANRRLLAPDGEVAATAALLAGVLVEAGILDRAVAVGGIASDAFLPSGEP
jgi:NitT/TauT family transport system substrate-binding protein